MPAERHLDDLLKKGIPLKVGSWQATEKWGWLTDVEVSSKPPFPEDIVMKVNKDSRASQDDTSAEGKTDYRVAYKDFGGTITGVELVFLFSATQGIQTARQPPPGTQTRSIDGIENFE